MRRRSWIAGAAMAAALALGAGPGAKADPAIQPFAEFVEELATAPAAGFVGQPESLVAGEAALEEMRRHLLRLYRGVAVDRSFAIDEQVFDCVPVWQQPAVRLQGLTHIDEPPPASALPLSAGVPRPAATTAARPAARCDPGTIPMLRVRLSDVARFKSLQDFFAKGPAGAGHPSSAATLTFPNHGYAHAFDIVQNYGGYSALSLYDPKVVTRQPTDEIFSLAQHWYAGGFVGGCSLQTAEVGWQVFPRLYHTRKPVLFIYFTSDDYGDRKQGCHTGNPLIDGCYNLTCGAFMQTDNSVMIGGKLIPDSAQGGSQQEIAIGYYFDQAQGDWWLIVNGICVGYFPAAQYRGGQLSRFAQEIDMGGEAAPGAKTDPYWAPIGSGAFAAAGYPYAAYHRSIEYRDKNNDGFSPKMTFSQPSPACWTASSIPAPGDTDWGTYFYFGGPGGSSGTC